MKLLSFVIPCYRSEETIRPVVEELKTRVSEADGCDYEIILVNDCSPDLVWEVISELSRNDPRIVGVDLSRNFGQASAVMAGLSKANGDYIITLDDDGQSPIDALKDIITKLETENLDVVFGVCNDAKLKPVRSLGSKLNSRMASVMYGRPKGARIVSFYIMRRYIVDEISRYTHPYPSMSGLIFRATNSIGYLNVGHRKRIAGKSGYSFGKLVSLWLNGFTAFSIKPLRFASILGFFLFVFGIVAGLVIIIRKLIYPLISAGWGSVISVLLLISGLDFIVLGLLGEYVGRIYLSINNTPQYVIRKCVDNRNAENERDIAKGNTL